MEEYFYLHNNVIHYTNETATKVLYQVEEIPQFKPLWERQIPVERRQQVISILEILKEKCSRHSNEGCRACQHEKSLLCIMKPFVTFTDHQLHPHQGHEFGDVSFTIDLPGFKGGVFIGIAKSYEKSTITESSPKGREMLQQFVSGCRDTRIDVLGLIIAAPVDQGLFAMCQDLARRYGKKVVMWTQEELLMAVDYSLEQYNLNVEMVQEDIKKEIEKMKKGKKAS